MAIGEIRGLGGALFGGIQGQSQARASKELLRRQSQLADLQNQTYRQTVPYYQQALGAAANYAGLGQDGVTQGANGHFQLGGMPGQQNFGIGGNWGSREDQLRLMQAEEDINRRQKIAGNQLRFNSNRMGLNEGAVGANLARLAGQGQQEYGQFRRGLAINAGQEQQQRLAQLQSLLGFGLGQGSQAQGVYGAQGALAAQQAGQSFAGLGNAVQNYQYMNSLNRYGGQQQPVTMDPNSLAALLARGRGQDYGQNF
jgi:hypothetical protein